MTLKRTKKMLFSSKKIQKMFKVQVLLQLCDLLTVENLISFNLYTVWTMDIDRPIIKQ